MVNEERVEFSQKSKIKCFCLGMKYLPHNVDEVFVIEVHFMVKNT